jgi:hypothetical protein
VLSATTPRLSLTGDRQIDALVQEEDPTNRRMTSTQREERTRAEAGTSLHAFPAPASTGKATATLATRQVADREQVVDELDARGVTFQRYDEPLLKPT